MRDRSPEPEIETVLAVLGPGDYLRESARRWRLVIVCALLGLSLGGIYWHFNPDKYESYTVVRFNPPQLPNRYVVSNDSLQTDQRLFALTQMLNSSLTARRLIETLGLYPERRRFQTIEDLVEIFQRDLAIQRATSPGAEANRGIPSLRISFAYGDPVKSRKVVEQLLEAVHETNRRYRGDQAIGTTDFLKSQVEAAEEQLQQIEDEISQLGMSDRIAGGHDWAFRVQELFNLEHRLGQVQTSLRNLQRERSDKQNDLVELESRLRRVDVLVTARTHEMPYEIRILMQWLNRATVNYEEVSQRYNPNYPDVLLAASEVEKLQKRLNSEIDEEVKSARQVLRNEINRTVDLLRGDIDALDASIRRQQVEEATLTRKASAIREGLRIPPESDMEYLRLTREYQATKIFHESLLQKRQESMVAMEMERAGRGEAVELVEPPTSRFGT